MKTKFKKPKLIFYIISMIMLMGCGGGGGSSGAAVTQDQAITLSTTPSSKFYCSTISSSKQSGYYNIYNNCLGEVQLNSVDYQKLIDNPMIDKNSLVNDFKTAFKDDFDFVIFILNTGTSDPIKGSIYGLYQSLDVRAPVRTQRLLGYQFLPYTQGLISGPSLHELQHEWSSKNSIPNVFNGIADTSHWGASSVGGQMGGFDLSTLKNVNGNVYSASVKKIYPLISSTGVQAAECEKLATNNLSFFGLNANGGNSIKYSNLELYQMGLIPSSQFMSVLVANNAKTDPVHYNLNDPNKSYFLADSFTTYNEDQIRKRLGSYAPAVNKGQKDFRAAVVVLTNATALTITEKNNYLSQLEIMSAQTEHASLKTNYPIAANPALTSVSCLTSQNFYTATSGMATLSVGGLAESLKN